MSLGEVIGAILLGLIMLGLSIIGKAVAGEADEVVDVVDIRFR